jgi:hypothetical protein
MSLGGGSSQGVGCSFDGSVGRVGGCLCITGDIGMLGVGYGPLDVCRGDSSHVVLVFFCYSAIFSRMPDDFFMEGAITFLLLMGTYLMASASCCVAPQPYCGG